MSKKKTKGQYGYRSAYKKRQLGKVMIGAAAILIQLLARNLTEQDAVKNVLTVMAILSVLPTANVASPLLAAWKYRTIPETLYQKVQKFEDKGIVLYDLILTTKEQVIGGDVVLVHPMGVYIYCPDAKLKDTKAEKDLNDLFAAHKLDRNVKIMKEEKAFLHRLEQIRPMGECEDDGSADYAAGLLKNLSM